MHINMETSKRVQYFGSKQSQMDPNDMHIMLFFKCKNILCIYMQLLKALYMKGLSLNNVKKFTYLYNTSHSKGFRELLYIKK